MTLNGRKRCALYIDMAHRAVISASIAQLSCFRCILYPTAKVSDRTDLIGAIFSPLPRRWEPANRRTTGFCLLCSDLQKKIRRAINTIEKLESVYIRVNQVEFFGRYSSALVDIQSGSKKVSCYTLVDNFGKYVPISIILSLLDS